MSNRYDDLIWQRARSHGIDPLLVKAIIAAESNFQARAFRAEPQIHDASYGLMQVLHGTARWMGYPGTPEGLYEPETNIEYGVRFLKYLRNHFSGDVPKMVSGYNTGPGNVRIQNGRFTNQAYVDRVFRWYARFEAEKKSSEQGVTLQPGLPQIGPVPASPQVTAAPPPALADTLSSLMTPENLPWAIAVVAAVGIAALGGGRR